MCITPNAVITQHPDNLSITNTYSFTGEPDIDGITVGASEAEEQEFVLSARSDRKVSVELPPGLDTPKSHALPSLKRHST